MHYCCLVAIYNLNGSFLHTHMEKMKNFVRQNQSKSSTTFLTEHTTRATLNANALFGLGLQKYYVWAIAVSNFSPLNAFLRSILITFLVRLILRGVLCTIWRCGLGCLFNLVYICGWRWNYKMSYQWRWNGRIYVLTIAQQKRNKMFVSVSKSSNEKNIKKSMTVLKLCERSCWLS